MSKVFTLVEEWIEDCDNGLDVLGVFTTEETANEAFYQRVAEIKEMTKGHSYDEVEISESKQYGYSWLGWQEGSYLERHTCLKVFRNELDEYKKKSEKK